jgi:hypothetical protein
VPHRPLSLPGAANADTFANRHATSADGNWAGRTRFRNPSGASALFSLPAVAPAFVKNAGAKRYTLSRPLHFKYLLNASQIIAYVKQRAIPNGLARQLPVRKA